LIKLSSADFPEQTQVQIYVTLKLKHLARTLLVGSFVFWLLLLQTELQIAFGSAPIPNKTSFLYA